VTTLILASGSARRLALLRAGGVEPQVEPADIDETPGAGESPVALVRRLAVTKAESVLASLDGDRVVLGADTEVVRDGCVLGKPADPQDARAMLRASSGRDLAVWSGVALATRRGTATRVVGSLLRFAALDDDEVDAYVATGEPFGAAGGFRIQGDGAALVAAHTGCWTNVVGLPTCQTARLLAGVGVDLVPDDC
jgi:septum formation protein